MKLYVWNAKISTYITIAETILEAKDNILYAIKNDKNVSEFMKNEIIIPETIAFLESNQPTELSCSKGTTTISFNTIDGRVIR